MKCYLCGNDTWVHVYRKDAFKTAWGCTSCGTAELRPFTCKCGKEFDCFVSHTLPTTCEDCVANSTPQVNLSEIIVRSVNR